MAKKHDNQTLFDALEHIVYEIQMYIDLTFTELNYPEPVRFAILEAWLIHLRCIDSMLQKRRFETDILLSDFAGTVVGDIIDQFTRDRINRELAHITTLRLAAGPSKEWNRVEIFRQAWPGIEKIIDLLDAWLNSYQPDSLRKSDLAFVRARGSHLNDVLASGGQLVNLNGNSKAIVPHIAVTYTYGYSSESQSDFESSRVPFR